MKETDSTEHDDWTAEADREGKVIVLGWQAVVLPVLIVAVVVAGFLFGRAMSAEPAAAPVAATSPAASVPGQSALQVQAGAVATDPATGRQVIPLQQASSLNTYPEDAVIDLAPPSHPLTNQPAPDFTMPVLGGDEDLVLSSLIGKPVMINFWATWCPPCRYEMPWIQNVYNEYKDKGLVVLAVNAGEKVAAENAESTVKQFVDTMGLTFPVLFTDLNSSLQLQQRYSVYGLPATFFVDAKGMVTDLHTGMFPNQVTLEAKVKRLLGEDTGTPTAQQ